MQARTKSGLFPARVSGTAKWNLRLHCGLTRIRSTARSVASQGPTRPQRASTWSSAFPSGGEDGRGRKAVLEAAGHYWTGLAGSQASAQAIRQLEAMGEEFRATGVLVFKNLISVADFRRFVAAYDALMVAAASRQVLHDFLDLEGTHLLVDPAWRSIILHPIFRLLIEYRLGRCVHVVDARAKDTYPIDIWAKENILHLDNSPFADECKVILSWRRGQALGPDGQDTVLFPGNRVCHGIRRTPAGEVWSSENQTLFATPAKLEQFIERRRREMEGRPIAVQINDPLTPLTTVFASSHIPHHRYRTGRGSARSSVTLAYHPAPSPEAASSLSGADAEKVFRLIGDCATRAIQVPLHTIEMSPAAFDRWLSEAGSAPTIELRKRHQFSRRPKAPMPARRFLDYAADRLMGEDAAALLDLKLYPDGREELRKKARKLLRELPPQERRRRLRRYEGAIQAIVLDDILSRRQLAQIAATAGRRCSAWAGRTDGTRAKLGASLGQLLHDLGEAAARTCSLQCFVSTNLMAFLAVDEGLRIGALATRRGRSDAAGLARSYLAGTIAHGQLLVARRPERNVP